MGSRRWRAHLRFRSAEPIVVEGDNYTEAHQNAFEEARRLAAERGMKVASVDLTEQVGEPWVGFEGVWDKPGVIAFRRALGWAFTQEEVDLLVERVGEVRTVLDSWNGEGCASLSIRVDGTVEDLTPFERGAILAPRPEGFASVRLGSR